MFTLVDVLRVNKAWDMGVNTMMSAFLLRGRLLCALTMRLTVERG